MCFPKVQFEIHIQRKQSPFIEKHKIKLHYWQALFLMRIASLIRNNSTLSQYSTCLRSAGICWAFHSARSDARGEISKQPYSAWLARVGELGVFHHHALQIRCLMLRYQFNWIRLSVDDKMKIRIELVWDQNVSLNVLSDRDYYFFVFINHHLIDAFWW
jgi:hypothetical protein